MRVRTLVNPFSCFQRFEKQDWQVLFPKFQGQIDVEIGCGNGLFLINYALKNPDRLIVGFEIKERLVAFVREKIAEHGLTNVHIFLGNGQIGLEDLFDDASIDRIFVFHPDPWPKKAHHKRRVINDSFLQLMKRKFKIQGQLYLSTDVLELWSVMTLVIQDSQLFVNNNDQEFWASEYVTRWHEMSLVKQKTLHYADFCLVK